MRFGDVAKHFSCTSSSPPIRRSRRSPTICARFLKGWFETIAFMRTHKDETVEIAMPVMDTDANTHRRRSMTN